MRQPATLGILAALLLSAVGSRAMTITSSSLPPAGNVLLARDVAADTGSYLCSRGLGSETQIGQTFRLASAVTLDRITVRVRRQTDVAGTLAILYFGTFAGPADETMDELLAAEIRALPDPLPIGTTTYLTFDIGDQHLDALAQYGFVLGFAGGDHPHDARLDVLHTGGDTYASGQAILWSGLQEDALPDDLVFFLQGTGSEPPPPAGEPLVLQEGRFTIEVAWATATDSGGGHPVALTGESGWFWFFGEDNVELLVKVLDGCLEPQHSYWVFMAGLTDVGVVVRVTDTVAGFDHTWTTTTGQPFLPIQDTWTFATCSDD
jgi:hypothetical protein